ncbi:hypothetical protein OR263_08905 [Streptomyces sp. NEAU-H22]|nr:MULTISPECIES: hypothetical protein [unclassified Streptomyces]MCX3286828.1 hypothetical protein [Streptomyces sp. NEAU-H22]WMD09329.1 hypothetical protein Q7C01_35360 [Streptomyces sp. FXY-T5]
MSKSVSGVGRRGRVQVGTSGRGLRYGNPPCPNPERRRGHDRRGPAMAE